MADYTKITKALRSKFGDTEKLLTFAQIEVTTRLNTSPIQALKHCEHLVYAHAIYEAVTDVVVMLNDSQRQHTAQQTAYDEVRRFILSQPWRTAMNRGEQIEAEARVEVWQFVADELRRAH